MKNSRLKISIITPSFNQGNFLEETILSVIESKYQNLDYVIMDGGSSDNSCNVIKRHAKFLSNWESKPDRGQSHAINKGLSQLTGEALNWINSDDYLEPGALKAIESAFTEPDVNIYIGISNIVKDNAIIKQSRGTDIYDENVAKTIGQARIDQPEHWWRKSIIDEIGPLNEALHYTMDRDWWLKYLLRYGLSGIKKENCILANFRLHGESKTVSQSQSFIHERDAYYRSMARHYGLTDIAKFIEFTTKASLIPLTNMPGKVDLTLLEESYSYFFLLMADEAYVSGHHKKVRTILERINPDHLALEDSLFADKLKSRSRLPATLIRFARKLKQ